MGEFTTYSLTDLIPVTPEVYRRLILRLNQALWPAHIVTVVLGAIVLFRFARRRYKYTGLVLGGLWIWVGITYHFQLYANLNWFVKYYGYVFVLEGLLFCLWDLFLRPENSERMTNQIQYVGKGLSVFGLIGYPLITPLLGGPWAGSHLFGISPDATAVGTIGFILFVPNQRWLLLALPITWCLISTLESFALGLFGSALPMVIVIIIALCSWSMDRWVQAQTTGAD